jgi:ring-1,2-phenylacetyl-CoA epoxidase subunit PaaC
VAATLSMPRTQHVRPRTQDAQHTRNVPRGGRRGAHTEHLEPLLADMQVLQRTYPGLQW